MAGLEGGSDLPPSRPGALSVLPLQLDGASDGRSGVTGQALGEDEGGDELADEAARIRVWNDCCVRGQGCGALA